MLRKVLLAAAMAAAAGGCGEEEAETGVPPSTVSEAEILADTVKRDKVDRQTVPPVQPGS